MKLFLYIIGTGFLFSCTGFSEEQYPRYQSFPNEETISAQTIRLDTVLFRYPFRIAVKDGIAVVMDLHNTDHYFQAFTYPGWTHMTSFGKRGESPDEMLSAEAFQFNSLDSLWTLDANKMQLTRWSISPAARLAKQEEIIRLDSRLVRSLDFYAMDSCILVPDYLGEHRFSLINYQGEFIRSQGSIPSETADTYTSHRLLAQVWRSFIDYNPSNGILAMATQLGETLEIYHLHTQCHFVIYGPNGEPDYQTAEREGMPADIMGFSDITVTDKYIYTIFQGVKFKDIIRADVQGESLEDGGSYIYVFDLEENPVKKYTLDRHIVGFYIDEVKKQIIALDVNSDDPILSFKLDIQIASDIFKKE